jgi:predicted transporter
MANKYFGRKNPVRWQILLLSKRGICWVRLGDFRILNLQMAKFVIRTIWKSTIADRICFFHNKKKRAQIKWTLVSFSNLFYLTGFIYVKQYRMSMDIKYTHLVTKEVNWLIKSLIWVLYLMSCVINE